MITKVLLILVVCPSNNEFHNSSVNTNRYRHLIFFFIPFFS
ncbi:unnamed protein product [Debaryomyces tyrocola]|nr:unnamed protein product [Debaryomyces tyrocola]